LKVSIGAKIIEGPFGGGNAFINNLANYLKKNNFEIINHLNDKDIDIILLINPLLGSTTSTFDDLDVLKYINFVNSNTISIQRINECDERKNTNYVNKKIISSNKDIDITIFVSQWLKELYIEKGLKPKDSYVVRGGPNKNIFNLRNKQKWETDKKIKIVTHHWSNNWMKGFDTYSKLDSLISEEKWNNKIEFTYIGNLPKNFTFQNTKVIPPLQEEELAIELKNHDLYITGSINEPSGNHHMEAAMSGLPILFINSGGIPEYCEGFGEKFELENLEEKLNLLIENYEKYFINLQNYSYDFENAAKSLIDIFEYGIENKNELINRRRKKSKYQILFKVINRNTMKLIYSFYFYSRKRLGALKRLFN